MATKKDEIKKKVAEKREEKKAAKKSSTKKQTKKVTKVTEEQLPKIAKEVNEPAVIETVDLEKFKDEKGEYDLTKATDTEVKSAFKQLKSDDEIVVTKTEVVNGDPSVIAPVEEKVDEVEVVEEKKESTAKKIIRKFNQNFGYLWNGQMIDF